jgi:uncharacterized phage-associated protein
MNQLGYPFAYKKATQALNFFARKAGGRLSKLKALKLVFFADRYHLRKYGRLITNDEYWAMDYGPVASNTKDLAEMSSFLGDREKDYAVKFLVAEDANHQFASKAPVDEEVLTLSDLEALHFAWDTFGRRTGLVDLTREYPEWKRFEAELMSRRVSRIRIRYEDFFENPPPGINPCHALTAAERNYRRTACRGEGTSGPKWN